MSHRRQTTTGPWWQRDPLPVEVVEWRRRELARLPLGALHALYASLQGRTPTMAANTLLTRAVLIDIIIWTEFADWYRVEGRGGLDEVER